MTGTTLRERIDTLWEERATLTPGDRLGRGAPIEEAINGLDTGFLRVATPGPFGWIVQDWLKKAVLLSFRLFSNMVEPGIADAASFDKIRLKFRGWNEATFATAGLRALPGAIVRRGAYIGRDVVLMPSFINIGAHVGDRTMIDTWSTIGSCAQIGRNCHISGGVGIGGVLEPLQAAPVIVEDDCFVGARCEIAEGVRVGKGAVIAMGVFLGASTRIVDRASGEVYRGIVPPFSVVVPGTMPGPALSDGSAGPGLACAVIVKRVDEATRSKTSVNELLRAS